MSKFCTRCGRPLEEGQICPCSAPAPTPTPTPRPVEVNINPESVKGFFEEMQNRMGIGDPELNKGDAYETGKQIVPECVKANESEIPVKQYKIATLRNRVLGIPYTKAIGRLQVTNKRVIFRAPGKCLAGRTTLQHEFAIDEISGIESRREYVFNGWDLLIGILAVALGGLVSTSLIMEIVSNSGGLFVPAFFAILIAAAGCVPFFMIKKRWLSKLLCLGASFYPMLAMTVIISRRSAFFSGFFGFLSLVILGFTLFTMSLNAIKPNLVLVIKTKSASEAIDIRRKRVGPFGVVLDKEDHTGYMEILPEENAEESIREIWALINDIQKLGDFGIEKWKK